MLKFFECYGQPFQQFAERDHFCFSAIRFTGQPVSSLSHTDSQPFFAMYWMRRRNEIGIVTDFRHAAHQAGPSATECFGQSRVGHHFYGVLMGNIHAIDFDNNGACASVE